MRSLPVLLRMTEELTRMPRVSPFQAFFHEPLMWTDLTMPRNWLQMARRQEQQFVPGATVGKQGYQFSLDVSEYKPNELTVKMVNNSVIIEGKSEQKEDDHGGYVYHQFLRRFALPDGYEADKTTSSLSSDGVLTINVPNPPAVEEALKERLVLIQQTGLAELNVKPNPPLGEPAEETKKQSKD
ncbi:heat shock protein 22 [Drosophila grimshawi]|uniref:GH14586 n=1 Tax=Drosophila grimshawi TaxID=7222 RepID=B4IYG9_DROGR|nr:heat shock protein 22 [Drosophila grimshawi]EDV97642.1 GH14586 [Drosophila grimshawi]